MRPGNGQEVAFLGYRSDNQTQNSHATDFFEGDRAMRSMKTLRPLCVFAICAAILTPVAMATATEKVDGTFTASDGVKIHYIEMGHGTPVILIHGYTGSAEGNWCANGVADALAKNHRVVAIDCRNHGKSDKPQPNGPGKAEDVVELMDFLKIP